MDYLYQLPERDKEEAGFNQWANEGLAAFLHLDLSGMAAADREELITGAWWEYVAREGLSTEQGDELLGRVQREHGPKHIPYSPPYPAYYAALVENTPLHEVELKIHLLASDSGVINEPRDFRYLGQILEERVNQLALASEPEAGALKVPRLRLAIAWLKGYEQRLAEEVERNRTVVTEFVWQSTKTDLAELVYSLIESGVITALSRATAAKNLGRLFGVSLGRTRRYICRTFRSARTGRR